MKWSTPLWKDPIGWSDKVAKTKVRVVICTLIHVAFITLGLVMVHRIGVLGGIFPIVFIGVGYPALYLVALHKLLKLARESQGAEQSPAGDVRLDAPEE